MSRGTEPSFDRTLIPQEGEDGEAYQLRLALRRAAKDFPERDPMHVVQGARAQLEAAKLKGRRGTGPSQSIG